MSKEKFFEHLINVNSNRSDAHSKVLDIIASELGVLPMDKPYEYVKEIQSSFDSSRIKYSDEYYDTLEIDRE